MTMFMLGVEHLPNADASRGALQFDTASHVSVALDQMTRQLDLVCSSETGRRDLSELINRELAVSVQTTYGGILELLVDGFKYSEHSERIATIISDLKHIESQLRDLLNRFATNIEKQQLRSNQDLAVKQQVLEFLLLLQLVDQYAFYVRNGTTASRSAYEQLLAEIRRLQTHFRSLVSSI